MEEELIEKIENALGPIPRLTALKELLELQKAEHRESDVLMTLIECLEISNADDSLWREAGYCALKLGRFPAAEVLLKSALALKKSSQNLFSVALLMALRKDFLNSLTICNYLIDSNYSEAEKLKNYVKWRLGENQLCNFEFQYESFIVKKCSPYEYVTKKVGNLYQLLRILKGAVTNKRWDWKLILKKGSPPAPDKNPTSLKFPSQYESFSLVAEGVSEKLFESTNEVCRVLFSKKLKNAQLKSIKTACNLELGLEQFLDTPMGTRELVEKLLKFLCKNNPHPSAILHGEVIGELLSIYFGCEDWLDLKEELLTLLEISNCDAYSHELSAKLRSRFLREVPELEGRFLKARAYASVAHSHYRTRDLYEKDNKEYLKQLQLVHAFANEAIKLIGDQSYYLWWNDTFLNKKELESLIEETDIDLRLVSIDEKLKKPTKKDGDAVVLFDCITKILNLNFEWDDPIFYWKKLKVLFRVLFERPMEVQEKEQVCLALGRYMSVLLYNIQDGVKIKKDHDIRALGNLVSTKLPPYVSVSNRTLVQLAVPFLDICRYSPELFRYCPVFLKKVFEAVDPSRILEVFEVLHSIAQKMLNPTKYHLDLGTCFEKHCFQAQAEPQLQVIYNWMYAFEPNKTCSCGVKNPQEIQEIPNSPAKLQRVLSFYQEETESYHVKYPENKNKEIFKLLETLNNEEKNFFVDCKKLHSCKNDLKNSMQVKGIQEFHSDCCPETNRRIANQASIQLSKELICASKDKKKSVEYLKRATELAMKGVHLEPKNQHGWIVLGQSLMWLFITGYLDLLNLDTKVEEDTVQEAIQAFETSMNFETVPDYVYEAIAILEYFQVEIGGKSTEGGLEKVRNIYKLKADSEIISEIFGLFLMKSKDPECIGLLKNTAYSEVAKAKFQNEPGVLKGCTDFYSKYTKYKLKGNIHLNIQKLLDLVDEDFEFMMRPYSRWKLLSKAAQKAIEFHRQNNSQQDLINLMNTFGSLPKKHQKNTEVFNVVLETCRALDDLCGDFKSCLKKVKILNKPEKNKIESLLSKE